MSNVGIRLLNEEASEELGLMAGRSFIYSGTAAFVCSGLNLSVGLINGLVNALATLIEAVIRPIFDELMGCFGVDPGTFIYRLVNVVVVLGFQIAMTALLFPGVHLHVLATVVTIVALHLLVAPGTAEERPAHLYTFLYL